MYIFGNDCVLTSNSSVTNINKKIIWKDTTVVIFDRHKYFERHILINYDLSFSIIGAPRSVKYFTV